MIRNLPIDAEALGLVAAGPCDPVAVWLEQDGRRQMSDRQAVDDDGVLLWNCYAMSAAGGRPEVVQVQVPAPQQPVLTTFGPLAFEGLICRVAVDRAGKLAGYWSARSVRDAGPAGKRNGHQEHKEGQPA